MSAYTNDLNFGFLWYFNSECVRINVLIRQHQWGFNELANVICGNVVIVWDQKISYALLAVTKFVTSLSYSLKV